MQDNVAISIKNLHKEFRLPFEKHSTLKGALINIGGRGYYRQTVLKDINLEVKKGEFLGILGRNGSGKSTLLKTMSGIYEPDKGSVTINGKLTPFIELGVGFNPELSGRDNVFLNGALLGFSRSEIQNIYDDIVAFAELEKFMDQKLKNYSSGMQVRLAFSIAIRANTDILVLDEVLAVGDEAFQRKCYDYFNELKARGKTVVLVTHDMAAVQGFCTRAVVISEGGIIFDGDTTSATDVYRSLNMKSSESSLQKKNKKKTAGATKGDKRSPMITEISTQNTEGEPKTLFKARESIIIRCDISRAKAAPNAQLYLKFNNPGGVTLAALEVDLDDEKVVEKVSRNGDVTIKWRLPGIFNDGSFLVSAFITDKATGRVHSKYEEGYEFGIQGWNTPNILTHPQTGYTVE